MQEEKVNCVDVSLLWNPNQAQYCSKCKVNTYRSFKFREATLDTTICEKMFHRGWTRNGRLYIKPIPGETCCENWQIRLDATKFKPNPKQLKIVRKFVSMVHDPNQVTSLLNKLEQEFFIEEEQIEVDAEGEKQMGGGKQSEMEAEGRVSELTEETIGQLTKILSHLHAKLMQKCKSLAGELSGLLIECEQFDIGEDLLEKVKFFGAKHKEAYFCNYGMLVLARQKKNLQKGADIGAFMKVLQSEVGDLDEEFNLSFQRSGYLIFEKKGSKKIKKEQKRSGKLKAKQEEAKKKATTSEKRSLEISCDKIRIGELTVEIVPASFDIADYSLYESYQAGVHYSFNESHEGYANFLCTKNLTSSRAQTLTVPETKFLPLWDKEGKTVQPMTVPSEPRFKMMGIMHMKYYLRGQLIAVNVIDILPQYMVSKYFFYQPMLKNYSLGVVSALIDIDYVRWMQLSFPELRYYSLDSYCQSNPKLAYKSQYKPFEIMCPRTHKWTEFTPQIKARIWEIINHQRECQLIQGEPLADLVMPEDISTLQSEIVKPSIPDLDLEWVSALTRNKLDRMIKSHQIYMRNLGVQLCRELKFEIPKRIFDDLRREKEEWDENLLFEQQLALSIEQSLKEMPHQEDPPE